MRKFLASSCIVCIAFFAITNGFAKQKKNLSTKRQTIAVNQKAPEFTLKNPDGIDVSLSSYNGHILFIDFWASWCMPCRASIPHLKEVYSKYHDSGFDILSVSIDAKPAAWNKALAKEQMPWAQVLDVYHEGNQTSEVALKYGAASVPFTVMLDSLGNVLSINPSHAGIDSLLQKIYGN